MAEQLILPAQLLDNSGSPVVAADNVQFYDTGTSTPRAIYSEAALSTNLGTTMDTDAGGRLEFSAVFVSSGTAVKVVFKDSVGATLLTLDPAPSSGVTSSAAEDISYNAGTGNPAGNVQAAIENNTAAIGSIDQSATVYTTTGSVDNYEVTLSPAPTVYSTGLSFWAECHVSASSGSGAFIDVNGLGPKAIMVVSGGGTKVQAVAADWNRGVTAYLSYDGTDFVMRSITLHRGTTNQRLVQLGTNGTLPAVDGGALLSVWAKIATQTISDDAAIDIDLSAGHEVYRIDLTNVIPATDGAALFGRLSNDAGVTFETTSYYEWTGNISSTSTTQNGSSPEEFEITANAPVGNDAELGVSGYVLIYSAANAATRTTVASALALPNTSGFPSRADMSGFAKTAEANDFFRLLFDSGNMSSGTITVSALT